MKIFPMTLIRTGGLPLDVWEPFATGMPDWSLLVSAEQKAASALCNAFDEVFQQLPDSPFRTTVYNARKAFFQRRKTPSLAFEQAINDDPAFQAVRNGLDLWKAVQIEKETAKLLFEQHLKTNFQSLQAIAKAETLVHALLFTSHDLLGQLPGFAQKSIEQWDKKDRRTAFSLLQYLTRALFKTSPLSKFTTVQVQPINSLEKPVDLVGEGLDSKSQVTPNVALLPAIYDVLLREPAFFRSLQVQLNPSIVSKKDVPIVWLYFDGEREAFQQMDPDAVVEWVVHTLLDHQRTIAFKVLHQLLEQAVDATAADLEQLLLRLIDLGLLEWRLPEKGLSPGWCGGLYQYLGYLPSSSVLTEAAYLLQWLRTAARTLPFQPTVEAQQTQRDARWATKAFLEKHGGELPPIPLEQFFFEDVRQDHSLDLPSRVLENLVAQLSDCWKQKDFHPVSPFRARLFDFAQKQLKTGESIAFFEFCQRFMQTEADENQAILEKPSMPLHEGKVGALLQVFKENGEYQAVLNAMYVGGGKMFARWLPILPEALTEQLKLWHNTVPEVGIDFPWQGWSNANFQPTFASVSLQTPDSRVGHMLNGRALVLGDLEVRKNESGWPQLFEKQADTPIVFTDLGLEAPESRPPAMQVLWHLGMPMVSADVLLDPGAGWEHIRSTYWRRKRQTYQSLVLAREAWELPQQVWSVFFMKDRAQAERIGLGVTSLKSLGLPRWFFAQFMAKKEKPQFFDMESPVSMLLLDKKLQRGSGNIRLTEMLPQPEQWLGDRVQEFVVEFG